MSGLSLHAIGYPSRHHGDPERVSPKIVHLVAAARPNFMKVAPLYHQLAREDWRAARIVHTGQHYDANMSDAFFRDLGLPEPAHHLEVGSGSHAEQTGRTTGLHSFAATTGEIPVALTARNARQPAHQPPLFARAGLAVDELQQLRGLRAHQRLAAA